MTRNELGTYTRMYTRTHRDSAELSATVADEAHTCTVPAHNIQDVRAHTHAHPRASHDMWPLKAGALLSNTGCHCLLACLLESHQLAQERQHFSPSSSRVCDPSHRCLALPSFPPSPTNRQANLTSSHLMNLPPFFSASWTHTGLSCSAWTPGLAPAMARDSPPASPDSS